MIALALDFAFGAFVLANTWLIYIAFLLIRRAVARSTSSANPPGRGVERGGAPTAGVNRPKLEFGAPHLSQMKPRQEWR